MSPITEYLLHLPPSPLVTPSLSPLPSLSSSHLQIVFLGKIMDELFVKVVEMKKIQGNVLLGNMKCQTREFFSFFPMVTLNTLLAKPKVKLSRPI